MRIKLTYFKPNGEYYTEAQYETEARSNPALHREVAAMRESRTLPGLLPGGQGFFHVLVEQLDREYSRPRMIPSKRKWSGAVRKEA